MKYYLSPQFLENHKKEPLKRILKFVAILIFISAIMIFNAIVSQKSEFIASTIIIIGFTVFFISVIKDDLLIIFKFKEYQPPNYTIEINQNKITWVNEFKSFTLDLKSVEQVKLYFKNKKIKHIILETIEKEKVIILDEIDKLEILVEELKSIIGEKRFKKTLFSSY